MKKWLLAAVFVVSWQTGTQHQIVPCVGKEPEGVICAKPVATMSEKSFKTEEAAKEFKAAIGDLGAQGKIEKRDK